MDHQLTALTQQIIETNRALAWHASLQTYLLIGLAAMTVVGAWAIGRDMRELRHLANTVAGCLGAR